MTAAQTTAATRTLRHRSGTGPQRQFWHSPAPNRLLVGGVGSGKTRAGCLEVLRQPAGSIGMVLAPTYVMLRDSTLRSFIDLAQRGGIVKAYHKAEMTIELTDGKIVLFRSADNPDRLRGPNLSWFYLDEAAMMDGEVWNIMIGRLRLAPGRAWATSTPRGKNWLAKLFTSGPDYTIVRSSTRENHYLPPGFVASLEQTYTQRMILQEVEGLFLEDTPGALWTRSNLDATRVSRAPDLVRVVVGVDPSGSSHGDACGIVVVGKGVDGHGYVLDDASIQASPSAWAHQAVAAYHRFQADCMVAEGNFGGEMVLTTIQTIPDAPYVQLVTASRGKQVRAEPIAAHFEHGRFHMVGTHPWLEEEMCSYDGSGKSPDRMDACFIAGTKVLTRRGNLPIEDVRAGDYALTRAGWQLITNHGMTLARAEVMTVELSDGRTLTGTPNHPIYTHNRGFIPLNTLVWTDIIESVNYTQEQTKWQPNKTLSSSTELHLSDTRTAKPKRRNGITHPTLGANERLGLGCSIRNYGGQFTVRFRQGIRSIIRTATRSTMIRRILNVSHHLSTQPAMRENSTRGVLSTLILFDTLRLSGIAAPTGWHGIVSMAVKRGSIVHQWTGSASSAEPRSPLVETERRLGSAHGVASCGITSATEPITRTVSAQSAEAHSTSSGPKDRPHARSYVVHSYASGSAPVYNLEVANTPEYFANGVLVHNCIWGATELGLHYGTGLGIS